MADDQTKDAPLPLYWHVAGDGMRCVDCGSEVWTFKEGRICSGCDREEPEPEDVGKRLADAEASVARARAIHPSREEADAAESALCPECIAPAPCRTRRALDGQA